MQLLRRAGYSLHTTAEFEIVRNIKERLCYVEPMQAKKDSDYAHEPIVSTLYGNKDKEASSTKYTMPDGSTIELGNEKQKAPEVLFKPDLIGLEYPGVHELIYQCISKCDLDLRKELYG